MYNCHNLADKKEYLPYVVEWLFNEWGDHKNNNFLYWESWVKSSLFKDKIPQTFIIEQDNMLLGTFSLWRCDLQSRQDLFPWLGGIIVKKEFRHQGIGTYIQKKALSVLKELGFQEAFLFTELSGYYEKTGWVFIEHVPDEKGNMVRLYQYKNIQNVNM